MRVALIVLFILFARLAEGQTLNFVIEHDGKQVGTMQTRRSMVNGQEVFQFKTHLTVRLLVRIQMDFTVLSRFEGGQLVDAMTQNFVNGKPHAYTRITREGTGYKMESNKGKPRTHVGLVDYCSVNLYYREPKAVAQVFSENYLGYQTLRAAGGGSYALKVEGKRENVFVYQGGQLQRVEIHHSMGDVVLRRVN